MEVFPSIENIFEIMGFSRGSVVKNPPASSGDVGLILGLTKSPEKGKTTHSNILTWQIPCTEEPGRLQSIGLQRVRLNSNNTITNNKEYILIMYNEIYILTVFVIKNLNPN